MTRAASVDGGVQVVRSSRPSVTAKRLVRELDARLCAGLAEGLVRLKELQPAYEHAAVVARAERATALAARLEGFDEDSDRALVERSDELSRAVSLHEGARQSVGSLADLVRAADEATVRARRADQALQRSMRSFRPVAGVTSTDVEAARDSFRTAESAVDLAEVVVSQLRAYEDELTDVQSSTRPADAEVVGAVRAMAHDQRQARRTAVRAALIALVAGAGIAAAVVGAIPWILGGLALALVPPAVELGRRALALRVAAETRVRGAEMRASIASQEILTEAEVGRWDRLDAERHLAEARRAKVSATARWHEVAGPTVDPAQATELIEALVDIEARRRELATARAVEDDRRQEAVERFLAIGFVPDDDLSGELQRLRRLLAVQSEAGELLAAAEAAERRMVAREALAGLMGTLDLPAMELALREPASAPVPPLVVIDDQDDGARSELRTMLEDLPAGAHVTVVTKDRARWGVQEGTGDAPITVVSTPVARVEPLAPPKPKPERPWFAS